MAIRTIYTSEGNYEIDDEQEARYRAAKRLADSLAYVCSKCGNDCLGECTTEPIPAAAVNRRN